MNDLMLVSLFMLFLLGAVIILAPSFTPRRYYFGLTVPPDFPASDAGRAIRRSYNHAVAAALIVGIIVVLVLPQAVLPAAIVPVPLTGAVAFFHSRSRVQRYSIHAETPVREAEISRGPEHLPVWTLLAVPPFAILAAVAVYLSAHGNEIPARFPVHWGYDGQPNGWALRTPRGVYGPLWFGAAIQLLLFGIGLATFYGSRRSPVREGVLKILIGTMYLMALIDGFIAMLPFHHVSPFAVMIPIPLFVIAMLVYSYKLSSDPDMPADPTPDSCWRLSQFYYNPADHAVFVQKRGGIGYTLNFGNPISWWITGGLLAMIPIMIFLARES